MCCLFDLSFETQPLFESHFVPSDMAADSIQVRDYKEVAITHSAGGPSEITIIPNRHFRQEPWLLQLGQWTHLNKIKCALHFPEIVLCINMGVTHFTAIKCAWSLFICATSLPNVAI